MAQILQAFTKLLLCLKVAAITAANAAPNPQYGPYPPPSSPAVVPSPSYPVGTVTAWDFIVGVPGLSRSAALLRDLGLDVVLNEPFGGTLLLPDDAAWEAYVGEMNYIPTPDPLGGRSDSMFWSSLMRYHIVPRVVSTNLPKSGLTVGTTYIREPGNSTMRRHRLKLFPPGWSGNSAVVSFAQSVWGFARIVLGANAVVGGGLVHIVDAVLQPDDLYPSMNAMYTRPELSNIRELMKRLNLTIMWSSSCLWISDDAYGEQAYEDIPQSGNDKCVPCWESSVGCGSYTYKIPGSTSSTRRNGNKPRISGNRGSVRSAAFDDLVDVDTRVQRALATGTHAIERYAGTFILPSDTAFIKGLPEEVDPEIWEPILQNHFVSAGVVRVTNNSNLLMSYDSRRGGFPRPRVRRSFLGQMRDDSTYTHAYSATRKGCGVDKQEPCLTIQYPTLVNGEVRTQTANIQARAVNLQTPGHFYHIIDRTMVPPCVTRKECIKAFTQPP